MVGWCGLAGLTAWLLVCRNWASLADWLALLGPHAPLSGPNAALVAVVFSATPMVLWSLLVDRVHRDPATGIDWARARPLAAVRSVTCVKLVGLWTTWALIAAAFCIARWAWVEPWHFAMRVLGAALVPMVPLSVLYVGWLDRFLVEPRDGAWHFGAWLLGRAEADRGEVLGHLRAWAVKGFFTAFMVSILPGGFSAMVTLDWHAALANPVDAAEALCAAMFLVDVHVAMAGYLFTCRPLAAQIRSAEPTLAGWAAALVCYPPFILMGDGGPLDYHAYGADWSHWLAGHPALLWGWGALLVALTGIYAWATVAFGLRFSNLTWRGTIAHGPYRFSRHPAYLAKNLYWWAATLPFLATTGSPVDAIRNTVMLAAVSAVYYARARTEEAHLLSRDPNYRAYHAWMRDHGLVTAPLARLGAALARWHGGGAARAHPAE